MINSNIFWRINRVSLEVTFKRHWLTRTIIAALLVLLLFSNLAFGDSAAINITLKNHVTQRSITKAAINLVSRSSQRTKTQTDENGKASIDRLEPGLYELVITCEGFQTLRLPTVRLTTNKSTTLTLAMAQLRNNLEETLVIGSTLGVNRLDGASTGNLDREALRSAAGSGGDVLRALDGLPGLFSDGAFSGFTVRGNGPRDNLILVDGIPFDKVVHFSDSFGELEDAEGGGRYSVFAPNTINNAEFQPGGWGAAYGGRAGSLLKLEVAEGNAETPSYTARLDLAGLEIGYDGPSRFRDDTTVLFSARQLNFGRLFEAIGLDDIGEPKLTDVILKTRSDLSNGDTVKFLSIYAPESYTRDINNALASDEDEPGNYEELDIVNSESDNSLLAATWVRLIGSDGELSNQIYYRNYSEQATAGEAMPYDVPPGTPASDIPIRFPITTSNRKETEYGWRLDYAQDNTFGRFSSGLRITQINLDFGLTLDDDWIRYEYNQEDSRTNPSQKYITLTPEKIDSRYQADGLSYALYGDQSFEWEHWDMRIGLRYDADTITDDSAIAPRFSATYQATKNLRVTTVAGRYVQSSFLGDRARDPSNAELEFEKNDQLSVGFKYTINSSLNILFEPYYQQLSNLVVKRDSLEQTYTNSGEGKAFGFDTAIVRNFKNGWSANATYSFNDSHIKDSPSGKEYEAEFSRPHALSLGGVWEANSRWKISGRFKLASGRLFDDSIIHENVLGDGEPLRFSKENTTKNFDRYKSYNSLNIRIDYRRSIRNIDVIAFIDIINLLGSENASSSEFNERTGKSTVEDGEVIPLFGLRFEW